MQCYSDGQNMDSRRQQPTYTSMLSQHGHVASMPIRNTCVLHRPRYSEAVNFLKFHVTLLLRTGHIQHSFTRSRLHAQNSNERRQAMLESLESQCEKSMLRSHPSTGERWKQPSMHLLLGHLPYPTPKTEICRKYSAKGIHESKVGWWV